MKNDYVYIVWQRQNGKEKSGFFFSEQEWRDSVLNEFYDANDGTDWDRFENIEGLLDAFGCDSEEEFLAEYPEGGAFYKPSQDLVEALRVGPVVMLNNNEVLLADRAPTEFDWALEMTTQDLRKYKTFTFDEALEYWEEGNACRGLIEMLKSDGNLVEFNDFRDGVESLEEELELPQPSSLMQKFEKEYSTRPLYVKQEVVDEWEDLYYTFDFELELGSV